MNPPNERPRGKLTEGSTFSNDEIASLKAQVQDMQLEIDILKETIDVLKKDPGINITILSNKEKAVIVDALKKIFTAFAVEKTPFFKEQLLLSNIKKIVLRKTRRRF